jgi:hypothetical protein
MSKVFKYPRTVINGAVRFNGTLYTEQALNAHNGKTVFFVGHDLADPTFTIVDLQGAPVATVTNEGGVDV